jgi:hypothetical protein
MLDKGIIERIVLDYKDIYKQVNVLLSLLNFVKLRILHMLNEEPIVYVQLVRKKLIRVPYRYLKLFILYKVLYFVLCSITRRMFCVLWISRTTAHYDFYLNLEVYLLAVLPYCL